MRYTITAILIAIQLTSSLGNSRSLQSISIESHETTYRSLIEERNLVDIHEHNKRSTKFQLAPNQFLSLTSDEFAAKMGTSFDLQRVIPIESPPSIGATITISSPFVVDWWASGKVSPIKNQGSSCSSCYAFTAIADIQSSFLISYGKLYDFSQQQIVDCSSTFGNSLCSSGFYLYSFQYIIKHGVNLESSYPYRGMASACKASTNNAYFISSYYAFNGNSCSTLTSLIKKRPVIVSLDGTNKYWQFYSSGILDYCGISNSLNHGVQVIAIYSFPNGTNYYVIKNSWGTGWGEQGKMRLDRNINGGNICSICSYMYYSIL